MLKRSAFKYCLQLFHTCIFLQLVTGFVSTYKYLIVRLTEVCVSPLKLIVLFLFLRLQEARLEVLKRILEQREEDHAELNTKRLDRLWSVYEAQLIVCWSLECNYDFLDILEGVGQTSILTFYETLITVFFGSTQVVCWVRQTSNLGSVATRRTNKLKQIRDILI